jgi:hypothetical protein
MADLLFVRFGIWEKNAPAVLGAPLCLLPLREKVPEGRMRGIATEGCAIEANATSD